MLVPEPLGLEHARGGPQRIYSVYALGFVNKQEENRLHIAQEFYSTSMVKDYSRTDYRMTLDLNR
jgi:hypothetical protein